jgi:hypothetical protein
MQLTHPTEKSAVIDQLSMRRHFPDHAGQPPAFFVQLLIVFLHEHLRKTVDGSQGCAQVM